VGGPALRRLTFGQRAGILKTLGGYLNEHKEELYGLSTAAGATRPDAWLDIEGGTGVLAVYASKGRKELPDTTFLRDGDPEVLAKDGSFLGLHLLVPREGVAVLINAFNFPVWGMLEKVAPALLAGVPVVVKPATPTAYVAEAAVRLMVDSGALPEGAMQLVCGSLGDAFDHLTGQDSVYFTGSAATATTLRSHPTVLAQSVRFTAEADSLNASVLGPAAAPGTAEFDLYVKEVAREMTTKAGQRCTAIRRALVPAGLVDDVVSALADRLAKVVVGDPRREEVRMGPLVSLEQRGEVERAVATLAAGAEIAVGGPDGKFDPLGADAGHGAFLAPTVLVARDAWGLHQPPPRHTPSTTWSRSGRCAPCSPIAVSTRPSTSPGSGRAAWWCRCSPPTPPRPAGWPSASGRTTAGCCWSTSGAARRRPGTAPPCPTLSTAARAGPAAGRSWAESARCTTTSSGWRCRVRPTRSPP